VSAFIDMHRDRFGVEPICETLDVSASAYHQRATGERSARGVEDERLTGRIRDVHEANYECYGYRRLHAQLVREGEQAGRDQIARLMGAAGIQGAKRRGKPWRTTIADPEAQRAADLVDRDFTAPAPDRLWVEDFTYLRSWQGRSFFSKQRSAAARTIALRCARTNSSSSTQVSIVFVRGTGTASRSASSMTAPDRHASSSGLPASRSCSIDVL